MLYHRCPQLSSSDESGLHEDPNASAHQQHQLEDDPNMGTNNINNFHNNTLTRPTTIATVTNITSSNNTNTYNGYNNSSNGYSNNSYHNDDNTQYTSVVMETVGDETVEGRTPTGDLRGEGDQEQEHQVLAGYNNNSPEVSTSSSTNTVVPLASPEAFDGSIHTAVSYRK